MFGMSMVMMPIMTNGLNQLPAKLYPHGTAINNTAQQVVGAIGTALFVTLMNSVATSKGKELITGIDPTTITEAQIKGIEQAALLEGIQFSFFIAAIVTIIALVLTLFLKRVDISRAAIEKLEKQ